MNITVLDVTLLSVEEYKQFKDLIPQVDWWWLRTPAGPHKYVDPEEIIESAYLVYDDGSVICQPIYRGDISMRYVLLLDKHNLKVGTKIYYNGDHFTVVSDYYAVADFVYEDAWYGEEEPATWENSNVKQYCNRFYQRNGEIATTEN